MGEVAEWLVDLDAQLSAALDTWKDVEPIDTRGPVLALLLAVRTSVNRLSAADLVPPSVIRQRVGETAGSLRALAELDLDQKVPEPNLWPTYVPEVQSAFTEVLLWALSERRELANDPNAIYLLIAGKAIGLAAQAAENSQLLESRIAAGNSLQERMASLQADADTTLEAAQRALRAKSATKLRNHFEEVAFREGAEASALRRRTFQLSAGTILTAVFLPYLIPGDDELVRLLHATLATVGLAGIATYAGRLADGHMRRARWAKTRSVQVSAMEPYVAYAPKEVLGDLTLEFARYAYMSGDNTASAGREAPEHAIVQLTQLANALQGLTKDAPRHPLSGSS